MVEYKCYITYSHGIVSCSQLNSPCKAVRHGPSLFMYFIHTALSAAPQIPGLMRLRHLQSDALTSRLDLIHSRLDLAPSQLPSLAKLEKIPITVSPLTICRIRYGIFQSYKCTFVPLRSTHTVDTV